jgi:hypothetical protein
MSASDITIVCTQCGERKQVATHAVARALTQHNNLHHNGESVAGVEHDAAVSVGVSDD